MKRGPYKFMSNTHNARIFRLYGNNEYSYCMGTMNMTPNIASQSCTRYTMIDTHSRLKSNLQTPYAYNLSSPNGYAVEKCMKTEVIYRSITLYSILLLYTKYCQLPGN